MVLCLICTQKVAKNSVVFNPGKHPWHGTANVEHSDKVGKLTQYVCRGCHSAKQVKYISVCCERGVIMCASDSIIIYCDFGKYIVHKCAGNVYISKGHTIFV